MALSTFSKGKGGGKLHGRAGELVRRPVGQRAVRALLVIVVSPLVEFASCVGQAEKNLYVQAFIAQPAIETFDVAILGGFPGTNKIQFHARLMRPKVHRLARKLATVAPRERGGFC